LNEMITVKISDLKENKTFSELVPEMTRTEYDDLVSSIRKSGVQQPIHILKDKSILDGRHRVRACKEIGIKEIQALVNEFNENQAIEFVRDTAIQRRNLTSSQKIDIVLRSESLIKTIEEDAKKRIGGDKKSEDYLKSSGSREPSDKKGRTNEQLAELAGSSKSSVVRQKKIMKESPELYEKVVNEGKPIKQAYDELPSVKRSETKPKAEPKPKPKLIIPEPEPMEPDEMKLFQAVDNLDFNMNQIIHYVKDNEEKLYEAICQTYDERPEFMEQAHKSIEVLHNLMNAYTGGKYNEQKI